MSNDEELLVDREKYLSHGVHIGTQTKHDDMEEYIFHVKKNQLSVLDLNQTDERIRSAARFLSKYSPEEILVVGRKEASRMALDAFSEEIGNKKIAGRFMPGTLTNPQSEDFMEPEVVIVTDPEEDAQAIDEAVDAKIPVVALADSGNSLEDIDLVIPANNKAENSIGLVYYLLAEQLQEENGRKIELNLSDFRPEPEETEEEE
ncbi:MAG: small subunit ribosomal protein S2 [Candidatus Nanohaloarchaea archaeon]|jgi:small subunit ribosomal protein S2